MSQRESADHAPDRPPHRFALGLAAAVIVASCVVLPAVDGRSTPPALGGSVRLSHVPAKPGPPPRIPGTPTTASPPSWSEPPRASPVPGYVPANRDEVALPTAQAPIPEEPHGVRGKPAHEGPAAARHRAAGHD